MKTLLALSALIAWGLPAVAAERPYAVDPVEIARYPEAYYSEHVTVRGMRCTDSPEGVQCVKDAGGKMLRVDGQSIGDATRNALAFEFSQGCKGSANLRRLACMMDVSFTPIRHEEKMFDTGAGTAPVVIVDTRAIDLAKPRR